MLHLLHPALFLTQMRTPVATDAPQHHCAIVPLPLSRLPYAMPAPLPATAYFLPFPSTSLAQPWYHLS
ncbi:hypothetical protein SORBI_3002G346501 [Sorghum bicolor]|uniref:Uncharacterized protein n=1 Tax=Sorghum bicolor TaxID=4558 RepID=A0A1W0W6Y0_SORBI|nr:hypothetical protein SORBI_3002G346501 [Sorghum bicolor]